MRRDTSVYILEYPEEIDGEAGKFVRDIWGGTLSCQCEEKSTIGDEAKVKMRDHRAGLEDSTGDTWWIYVVCPNCEYEHSFEYIKSNKEDVIE